MPTRARPADAARRRRVRLHAHAAGRRPSTVPGGRRALRAKQRALHVQPVVAEQLWGQVLGDDVVATSEREKRHDRIEKASAANLRRDWPPRRSTPRPSRRSSGLSQTVSRRRLESVGRRDQVPAASDITS